MLYVPSIFGENLMDDWFNNFDEQFFGKRGSGFNKNENQIMKTDVKESDDAFTVDVELPGFTKDDIQLKLTEGVLTISAVKNSEKEEKDKETGRVIRKERYSGSMKRSFYVGEDLTEDDIKAKYENGVLTLTVPKKEAKKEVPQEKYIAIEG